MIIVKLDPKTWDRGSLEPPVKLLGRNGMCCMGFAALARGAMEEEIEGFGTWSECKNETLSADDEFSFGVLRYAKVYSINDALGLSDKVRVKRLNAELEKVEADFRFELEK